MKKKTTGLRKSDLHIALDKIERGDGHVSETAAKDSSCRTGGVEGRRVHLDLLARLFRRRDDEVLSRSDRLDIR